ncbi:stage II sporulation protein R [Clostridium botulinum]|uniref:stage II sporulation protein R n=1 Tax=Clostridium botulinum TaxID=1491 RepID=UPI000597BEEE|nr:stage II sporulation protein R [Clostridium botulinum]KIL08736.1 stage II sporulation protein R [Clostridium botulinum]MBY6932416.1 stage II sporulation protein R [Clostridium botulinum]NFL82679.1 stage II sporulation protein R [Clostridium botulinum]NFN11391.1 stage II sporulation protein R [Clostridium botulinum]NFO36626.1 stage II sporulation protein R [Clostridium botulinum]
MKKVLSCLMFIIIFSTLIVGCTSSNMVNNNNSEELNYEEVKNSLIRFHVIANSDTNEDQSLKLKVRDEVINYLYPYLNKSDSLDESREIIKNNFEEVKLISEKVIKENNYNYDVDIELSRENFPEKAYGNIVLPQGNYEAFRIIIGSGQGRNWWCVMFPPLCFVDESKAKIEYEKTQNKIKEEVNKKDSKDNIKIKFKVVEVIDNLLK